MCDSWQLNAEQSLVFTLGYSQFKIFKIGGPDILTYKEIGFRYYLNRRTGLTTGYELVSQNDASSTNSSLIMIGLNHYITDNFGLKLQYSKGKEGNPDIGAYKYILAELKVRF